MTYLLAGLRLLESTPARWGFVPATRKEESMKRSGTFSVGLGLLLVAAVAGAQPPAPTPGAEHRKLEAWVGDWTMEGVGKDGPASPEHKVVGKLRNRWILGGFFVEITHLWKDEGRESRFLEIVGYDPYDKAYTSHEFRPNGTVVTNSVSFNDRTYVVSGPIIGDDGKPEKWTCTWVFAADGASQSGTCETEKAGVRWTSWTGKGTKAKAR